MPATTQWCRTRLWKWAILAAPCITAATQAHGEYTAINLYPLFEPNGLYAWSAYPSADTGSPFVGQGQAVGAGGWPFGTVHALVWNGSPVPVDLNIPVFDHSAAVFSNGEQQVGYAWNQDSMEREAMVWNGTAASGQTLNPTQLSGILVSAALATDGIQQVGSGGVPNGYPHALLWNGTARSAVDLNPAGFKLSAAMGVGGGEQVGGASDPVRGISHAMLWRGTAASALDLQPVNLTYIINSTALATNGSQQVGSGYDQQTNLNHALLWNGTAASAVDLHPNNLAGFGETEALATNGSEQVGYGRKGNYIIFLGPYQALLWHGSPDSAVDLSALLPASITGSLAQSIDAAGDAFGIAGSSSTSYAVEWLPHAVLPGDTNLDGKVDFNDLITLGRNYGKPGGWLQGNFDWDQTVDFSDLVTLARNYGQQPTATQLSQLDPAFRADVERAFADVPEPVSVSLLAFVEMVALRRRRR